MDGINLMRPIPNFGCSNDELKDPVTYPSCKVPLFVYKPSILFVDQRQSPPPFHTKHRESRPLLDPLVSIRLTLSPQPNGTTPSRP